MLHNWCDLSPVLHPVSWSKNEFSSSHWGGHCKACLHPWKSQHSEYGGWTHTAHWPGCETSLHGQPLMPSTCQNHKYRLIPGQATSPGHAVPHESERAWRFGFSQHQAGQAWWQVVREAVSGGKAAHAVPPAPPETELWAAWSQPESCYSPLLAFVGNFLLYTSPGVQSAL